jgi:hypothetical protein
LGREEGSVKEEEEAEEGEEGEEVVSRSQARESELDARH